ncbi:MAG: hypothetical protein H6710_18675 [Myxococcales bacterium]|nr:hypothetical protein [Myxococcales bacterium]MCB9706076.1 hypothetical protein [Myxococcales bacterium]
MKTLTKTLLMATTLTLAGGCDDGADLNESAEFGGGDVALRPGGGGFSGISLNGPVLNVEEIPAIFDTKKGFHQRSVLVKVCLTIKDDVLCLDEYWVDQGQLWGRKGSMPLFSGADFVDSAWYVKYDADDDGVPDSSFILRINHMDERPMPAGIHYVYDFVYNTWEVGGLLSSKIEQSKEPIYLCEQDPDTGSYGMTAIRDMDVDYKTAEMLDRKNTITLGCVAGGIGKAPTWNYFHHLMGSKAYTTVIQMIRADYCGDNLSWTMPGTKLAMRDKWGFVDSTDPSYKLEAIWEVGVGAVCVYKPRHADPTDIVSHCGMKLCDASDDEGAWGGQFLTQNPT